MAEESAELFRSWRSLFGAVLGIILAVALGVWAVAASPSFAAQQHSRKWGTAMMTMSAPQEMFYLPYPPDPVDCGSDQFVYARSLEQLPGRIRLEGGGFVDIADFGEPYDWGRGPAGLPTHRFAGAAIGHDHIFVVVEGVGISTVAHDVLWSFERRGTQWAGHTDFGGGATVSEILDGICRRPEWRRHVTVGHTRLDCEFNPHGMITIKFHNAQHSGAFVARTRDRGNWRFSSDDIKDASSRQAASAEQRLELLQTLRAIQPLMSEQTDCHFWVDRYVNALTSQAND